MTEITGAPVESALEKPKKATKKSAKDVYMAVRRRKTAIASVVIEKGNGPISIKGLQYNDYV